MEQKEFDNMMEDWLRRQENKAPSRNEETDWAVRAGITDGTKPQAFLTYEEAAVMVRRALEYFFQQIVCILREE